MTRTRSLRRSRKAAAGQEELPLVTDVEGQAHAQEMTEAETSADDPIPVAAPEATAQTRDPSPEGDLLAQADAEATSEVEATEGMPEDDEDSPQEDDFEGTTLLDISRDADYKAQENTLAAGLADIPIQDLLNDLVSVSQGLGIVSRLHAEPEIASRARAEPDEEIDTAELEWSQVPSAAAVPGATGYRRYALHGLLLGLTLAVAIAVGLVDADRLASSEPKPDQRPPATATAASFPGVVVVRQEHPAEIAAPPTPSPTPEPRPTYFLYTVQRGDTLSSIAEAFDVSPDFVLWSNPDVIDDPNLLLAGDEILIPSVAGIIYYLKPWDVISAIVRLLPERQAEDPGLRPHRPGPPD